MYISTFSQPEMTIFHDFVARPHLPYTHRIKTEVGNMISDHDNPIIRHLLRNIAQLHTRNAKVWNQLFRVRDWNLKKIRSGPGGDLGPWFEVNWAILIRRIRSWTFQGNSRTIKLRIHASKSKSLKNRQNEKILEPNNSFLLWPILTKFCQVIAKT